MYRKILSSIFFYFLLSASTYSDESKNIQVLFVGNSLTYVGNMPAVFEAYSRESGTNLSAYMVAIGGFSLDAHLEQDFLPEALSQRKYDYVVLQERGGDFSCEFNEALCKKSRHALGELVHIVKKHGATPVLLGSYQLNLFSSYEIEESESKAANIASIKYIPVSSHLYRASNLFPDFNWLNEDGGHPGNALTLLYSALLNDALIGGKQLPESFVVNATDYGVNCSFKPVVISAMDSSLSCGEFGIEYSSELLKAISKLLGPLGDPVD